jgi:pantothenate kinase
VSTLQRQPLHLCACCRLELITKLQNRRRVRLQRVSIVCFGLCNTHVPLCNTLPSNRSWVRSCHLQPCPSLPLPPPSSHHPLIIGISGPSGCGKSALARSIKAWSCSRNPAAHIECSVLSMDSFFNRNLCGRFGHWENPEGIRIA